MVQICRSPLIPPCREWEAGKAEATLQASFTNTLQTQSLSRPLLANFWDLSPPQSTSPLCSDEFQFAPWGKFTAVNCAGALTHMGYRVPPWGARGASAGAHCQASLKPVFRTGCMGRTAGQAPSSSVSNWQAGSSSSQASRAPEGHSGAPGRRSLLGVPPMCLRKQTAAEEIAPCLEGHTTFGAGSRRSARSTLAVLCCDRAVDPAARCWWLRGWGDAAPYHHLGSNLGCLASSPKAQTSLSFSQPVTTFLGGIVSRFQSLGSNPCLAIYGHVTQDRLPNHFLICKMGMIIFLPMSGVMRNK